MRECPSVFSVRLWVGVVVVATCNAGTISSELCVGSFSHSCRLTPVRPPPWASAASMMTPHSWAGHGPSFRITESSSIVAASCPLKSAGGRPGGRQLPRTVASPSGPATLYASGDSSVAGPAACAAQPASSAGSPPPPPPPPPPAAGTATAAAAASAARAAAAPRRAWSRADRRGSASRCRCSEAATVIAGGSWSTAVRCRWPRRRWYTDSAALRWLALRAVRSAAVALGPVRPRRRAYCACTAACWTRCARREASAPSPGTTAGGVRCQETAGGACSGSESRPCSRSESVAGAAGWGSAAAEGGGDSAGGSAGSSGRAGSGAGAASGASGGAAWAFIMATSEAVASSTPGGGAAAAGGGPRVGVEATEDDATLSTSPNDVSKSESEP